MMQLPHGQCGNADATFPAVGDNDLAPIVCHLYDPHGFRNSPDSAHVGLHNINVSPIQSTGVIFIDEPLLPSPESQDSTPVFCFDLHKRCRRFSEENSQSDLHDAGAGLAVNPAKDRGIWVVDHRTQKRVIEKVERFETNV